jgi:hypothetical protein
MKITVVNKHNLSDPLPGVTRVYVGRPSPLGNPYVINSIHKRSDVVAKYRQHLWNAILSSTTIQEALIDLLTKARSGPLELVCWCAPQACHADVIKAALEWLDKHEDIIKQPKH